MHSIQLYYNASVVWIIFILDLLWYGDIGSNPESQHMKHNWYYLNNIVNFYSCLSIILVYVNWELLMWKHGNKYFVEFQKLFVDIRRAIEPKDLKESSVEDVALSKSHKFKMLFNNRLAYWLLSNNPSIDHNLRPKECENPTLRRLYFWLNAEEEVFVESFHKSMLKEFIR